MFNVYMIGLNIECNQYCRSYVVYLNMRQAAN